MYYLYIYFDSFLAYFLEHHMYKPEGMIRKLIDLLKIFRFFINCFRYDMIDFSDNIRILIAVLSK